MTNPRRHRTGRARGSAYDEDAPLAGLVDAAQIVESVFGRLRGGLGPVIRAWQAAVGPTVAANCVPVRMSAGTLHVRCTSAAWAQELGWSTGEYLDALRNALGDAAPERLQAHTGAVHVADSKNTA